MRVRSKPLIRAWGSLPVPFFTSQHPLSPCLRLCFWFFTPTLQAPAPPSRVASACPHLSLPQRPPLSQLRPLTPVPTPPIGPTCPFLHFSLCSKPSVLEAGPASCHPPPLWGASHEGGVGCRHCPPRLEPGEEMSSRLEKQS